MVQPLWITVWQFLKKVKQNYHTIQPILGTYPKELLTGTRILMFIAALFTVAKRQKQTKCPSTDEWIKKVVYPHNITQPEKGVKH